MTQRSEEQPDQRLARRRLCARVHGRVHGVGFRQFVADTALRLGLVGFVRNDDSDRSVEVLAEGPADALTTLLQRLKDGPLLSRVERVDSSLESSSGTYAEFQIRQ